MDGIFAVKLVRRSFDSGLRPALRMTNFRCGLWNGHDRSLRGGGDDVLRQSQIAVFPEEYRKALGYLGSHSGRDGDKVAVAGLTPVFEGDYTTFAEAKLTLVCRKLYRGTIEADGFVDTGIVSEHYPNADFHDFYIGHIVKVLTQE